MSDSLSGSGAKGGTASSGAATGGQPTANAGAPDAGMTTGGTRASEAGASALGGTASDAGAGVGGDGALVGDDTAPSCAALSKTACHGESCCTTLPVPACDGCAYPPGNTTHMSAFSLDKYEVTQGRFRAFVQAYKGPPAAGAGAHPHIADSGWLEAWNGNMPVNSAELVNVMQFRPCKSSPIRTWTNEPGVNEQRPANCLTWYEAFAFCAWEGAFLPSELEWQFAATGGTEGRTYPWAGEVLDADHALYGACGNGITQGCEVFNILEVGSKPAGAGKWGHLDLVGSVWEWLLDSPTGDFPAAQPCNDCASLGTSSYRTIRGGSWPEDSSYMVAARRNEDPGDSVWYNVGIRCAHAP